MSDADNRPLRRVLAASVRCLLEAAIMLQLALGEYVEAAVMAVLPAFTSGRNADARPSCQLSYEQSCTNSD